MLKKLLIALAAFVVLVIAAAIVIPLVVDVDKYRPRIVREANERVFSNGGKLELGKLSLSLWGQVRVEVAGVKVTDQQGREVLNVGDAWFHVPFSSILSGAPLLTFKMDKPLLNVVKDKAGKLNVMSLIPPGTKVTDPGAPQAPAKPGDKPAAGGGGGTTSAGNGGNTEIPAMAARARLGVELTNATLNYKDELTGLDSKTQNLNLMIRDLSLSRPTEMELWADLDTKMAGMAVKGPVRVTMRSQTTLASGKLDHLTVSGKVDADKLDISMSNLFHKSPGMDAHVDLAMTASDKLATIEKLAVKFFNAEVDVKGTVSGLDATPVVAMDIHSNDIDLKPWNQLVPMLKEYDLAGKARLDAKANGPSDKLGYSAKLTVASLTAKAPTLKAQPRIDGQISIITDQIESLLFTMKAPGNELTFKGKLVGFAAPKGDFDVTSPGLDLDQLYNFPPPAKKGEAAKAEAPPAGEGEAKTAGGKPAAADVDASVAPIRENKAMAQMAIGIGFNLKSVKAKEMRIGDVVGRLYFKDLVAGLEGFSMKIFGGVIRSSFSSNLRPAAPTYKLSASVADLDIQQASASQMELFKNTLLGKASFTINGEGASFNSDKAIGNLKATGNLKVADATFATIDVAKMVSEGLNGAIDKIADKIPPLKGKKLNVPGGKESKYESVTSDFTIGGGVFNAPNFVAKAMPNNGIDLRGSTKLNMKSYDVDARWEVIDTYNLTHARDLSVEQMGTKVEHILAKGSDPVKFPVTVGGNAYQPKFSYTEVPEYLGAVALANVATAATGRAKQEASKKAGELLKKAPVPEAVQKPLDDLRKKLFH